MSTPAIWCRVVRSRDVHTCYMVSRCLVSRCQSPQFWWSRDVRSRVFSRPVGSVTGSGGLIDSLSRRLSSTVQQSWSITCLRTGTSLQSACSLAPASVLNATLSVKPTDWLDINCTLTANQHPTNCLCTHLFDARSPTVAKRADRILLAQFGGSAPYNFLWESASCFGRAGVLGVSDCTVG